MCRFSLPLSVVANARANPRHNCSRAAPGILLPLGLWSEIRIQCPLATRSGRLAGHFDDIYYDDPAHSAGHRLVMPAYSSCVIRNRVLPQKRSWKQQQSCHIGKSKSSSNLPMLLSNYLRTYSRCDPLPACVGVCHQRRTKRIYKGEEEDLDLIRVG